MVSEGSTCFVSGRQLTQEEIRGLPSDVVDTVIMAAVMTLLSYVYFSFSKSLYYIVDSHVCYINQLQKCSRAQTTDVDSSSPGALYTKGVYRTKILSAHAYMLSFRFIRS